MVAVVYAASVIYALLLEHAFRETGRDAYLILARQLPGQLAYFAAGACAWWYRGVPQRHLVLAMAVALALLLFAPAGLLPAVRPLALGVLVIGIAVALPGLGNVGRHGDFSYGIYILHFPTIQVLVSLGWFHAAPLAASAGCVLFVAAAAWLSWNLIEQPMLKASSHYVKALAPADRRLS